MAENTSYVQVNVGLSAVALGGITSGHFTTTDSPLTGTQSFTGIMSITFIVPAGDTYEVNAYHAERGFEPDLLSWIEHDFS